MMISTREKNKGVEGLKVCMWHFAKDDQGGLSEKVLSEQRPSEVRK